MKKKEAGSFEHVILTESTIFCEICPLCKLLPHFMLKISG